MGAVSSPSCRPRAPLLSTLILGLLSTSLTAQTSSQKPFTFSSPLYEVSLPEGHYASPSKALEVSLVPPTTGASFQITSLVDSRSQNLFSVDSATGSISVVADLDRELMDGHYLKVLATDASSPDSTYTATTTVHIRVSDANDNGPKFEKTVYNASVHEVTPVGAVVAHVHATDADAGNNGKVSYTIKASSADGGIFAINQESGAISLRRQLDREVKRRHVLKVFASDSAEGGLARISNATVVIKVIDDNDNHPQFKKERYRFHVSESIQWKDKPVVGSISAFDQDKGNNAKLKYSLIGGNNDRVFDIDGDDGTLRVVRQLDREAKKEYSLIVRVQDMGSPPKSNTSQIVLSIDDVNDNAPKFPTTKYYRSVSENVPKDYAILQVQAFDHDEGLNSRVTYNIPTGYEDLPFAVDRNTGWIKANKNIDREIANSFHFPVVAMDAGNPPLSSSVQVTLTVLDANDNDPQFDKKEYRVSVKETVPLGSTVIEVKAIDGDQDAQLRYEIVAGNTRNRFTISSQNGIGVISLAQPLNFRDESKFVVIVNAVDQGGRFGTCNVEITIVDANDHPPKFENTPYFADIFEDTPVGSTVLMLFASDQDYAENARISYKMKSDSKYFAIDSSSGALTVASELDREEISTFILSVVAEDAGLPRLADETDVEISVLDVNDNPPTFTKPLFTGTLWENAAIGTKVMRVNAIDRDERDNGKVRYRFEEPVNKAFVIDPVSGDVRSNSMLDRETSDHYELVVVAFDGGIPENIARTKVMIEIMDVNDNPPIFHNESIFFHLKENSPYGTKIGQILVNDPDVGENSEISFQLLNSSDSKYFYLGEFNKEGGISLFAQREFDYEIDRHEFSLGIRAESPPLRTDANIVVHLVDVNDNQPELKDFHIIHNLQSDEYMFEELGHVPATDADPTSKLTYNITYGNNADFLSIDHITGEIRLSPSLSSNVNIRAQLGLVVSDGQNEARSTLRLQINHVTAPMLKNSVTVRFANVTRAAFLSPFLAFFEESLAMSIPCSKDEVVVFGIKSSPVESAVNVTFSVARGETNSDLYLSPSHIKQRIYLQQEIIEKVMGLQMLDFQDDICVREPCLNYERCVTEPKFGKEHYALAEGPVKFRSIDTLLTYACFCPNGFTGMTTRYTCDTKIDLCYSSPCQNGANCQSTESDFFCQCPPGYEGQRCEIKVGEGDCSVEQEAVCQSPSKCVSKRNSDKTSSSWSCQGCSDNVFYDEFCQLTARSFSMGTYAAFSELPQRVHLNVSLEFATQNPTGTLLFNGRLNDENDYLSLRLKDSNLVFQFSTGELAQMVMLSRPGGFSNGQFHRIEVAYNEENATLSFGHCDVKLALEDQRFIPETLRCANATIVSLEKKKSCGSFLNQCSKFLDLSGPLLLGGFPSNRKQKPEIDTDASFVGCIKNLYVNNKMLNLHEPVFNNGSLIGCPEKRNFCLSDPCKNGGQCLDGWGSYKCTCPAGWTGKDCGVRSNKVYGLAAGSQLSFQKQLVPIHFPWMSGLSFKTSLKSTPLLTLTFERDSIRSELSIRDGMVVYKIQGKEYALASSAVSDNEWHNLRIKWMGDEVWLNLDYGQHERTHEHLSPLAGNKVMKIEIARGFQGCVQDIQVGEESDQTLMPLLQKSLVDCARYDDAEPKEGDDECRLKTADGSCESFCSLNLCEGTSKCLDTHGGYQCNCAGSNQAGRYCSRVRSEVCPRHWWGTPVCGPCNCDTQNGFNETCNANNGRCSCKDFHYPKTSPTTGDVTCLPCDCYTMGSTSATCDQRTGQCSCKEGVIGKRCDSCSHSFAELTSTGCKVIYGECPAEYADQLWWERTEFGSERTVQCPELSQGFVQRNCSNGGWINPLFADCTHTAFLPFAAINASEESWYLVKKLRSVLERSEQNQFSFNNDRDITYNATVSILDKETGLTGFKLAHRKDREFLNNVVELTSWLLKTDDDSHNNLIELSLLLQRYGFTLLETMTDTYTNPFEIVADRLVFGLDRENELDGPNRLKRSLPHPSTMAMMLTEPEPTVTFPKYNNFMRDPSAWNEDRIVTPRSADTTVQYVIFRRRSHNISSDNVMIPKLTWNSHIVYFSGIVTYSAKKEEEEKSSITEHQVTFKGRVAFFKNQLHCVQWSKEYNSWSSLECLTSYESPANPKERVTVTCVCSRNDDDDDYISTEDNDGFQPLLMTVIEESVGKGHVFFSTDASSTGDLSQPLFVTLASVAVLILLATVTCLAFFNRSGRNSVCIQRNIAASAFVFQITYLVTLLLNEQLVDGHFTICKAMTLVLHFSSVAMFSWSFLSSFHIYRMLTELRDINHGAMTFYTALGFGIPAVVVILTVGVSGHNYGGQEVCWLSYSSASIWGMIAPEIICIVFSIIFTLINIRTVFSVKTDIDDFSLLRVLFFVNIGIIPLLIGFHVTAVVLINEVGTGMLYAYLGAAVVSAAYLCIGFVVCDRSLFIRQQHNTSTSSTKRALAAGGSGPGADVVGCAGGGYHMGTTQSGGGRSALSYRSHHRPSRSHFPSAKDHLDRALSVASTTSHSTYQTYQKNSPGQDVYGDHHQYIGGGVHSDTESDMDKRSFDLASSHSSDEENEFMSRQAQLSVNDFPKY